MTRARDRYPPHVLNPQDNRRQNPHATFDELWDRSVAALVRVLGMTEWEAEQLLLRNQATGAKRRPRKKRKRKPPK